MKKDVGRTMEPDDKTNIAPDKAAIDAPVVRHVSSRLTPAEIERLRQDKKESIAYARKAFQKK